MGEPVSGAAYGTVGSAMMAVRAYVTAQDATQYSNLDPYIVVLDLTHSNLQQRHAEIRFDKRETIAALRQRIHQKSGTSPDHQHLQVFHASGDLLVELPPPGVAGSSPETRKLGYYGITEHGMRVHCIDTNPFSLSANGGLENTSLVNKFVMSDQEYDQRSNTLRSWVRQKREEDPNFSLQATTATQSTQGLPLATGMVAANGNENNNEDYGPLSVQGIEVGSRCQVFPGERRGRVAWVGSITNSSKTDKPTSTNTDDTKESSYWVGIVLDEPLGRNDGTWAATGRRYFEAPPNYGIFCRGKNVQVGDFPERNIFDSDDEDEI